MPRKRLVVSRVGTAVVESSQRSLEEFGFHLRESESIELETKPYKRTYRM